MKENTGPLGKLVVLVLAVVAGAAGTVKDGAEGAAVEAGVAPKVKAIGATGVGNPVVASEGVGAEEAGGGKRAGVAVFAGWKGEPKGKVGAAASGAEGAGVDGVGVPPAAMDWISLATASLAEAMADFVLFRKSSPHPPVEDATGAGVSE